MEKVNEIEILHLFTLTFILMLFKRISKLSYIVIRDGISKYLEHHLNEYNSFYFILHDHKLLIYQKVGLALIL